MAAMWLIKLGGVFLLWTLAMYWLHRLAHWRSPKNLLYRIHQKHHQQRYDVTPGGFKIESLWWNFGHPALVLDILLTMTLPLVLLTLFFPSQGLCLLVFHYLYEVFLGDDVLDHNLRIQGRVTKFFAWGRFHMTHHYNSRYNYCLLITLWDIVFRTVSWTWSRRVSASP